MGATLAFLGVDRCMPLMHGGQGCTSFTKVYFTRHFAEPIAIQTTAVTDVTAILDGGDYSIVEAVKNITAKVAPSLIGLYTTGLTETKGDDIRGVASKVDFPLVWVNTPDYEGGLESGWALAAKALIEQLVEPPEDRRQQGGAPAPRQPHARSRWRRSRSSSPPSASRCWPCPTSPPPSTATSARSRAPSPAAASPSKQIRALGDAGLVISVGASMRPAAAALLQKNPAMRHHHFDHLQGLEATDALVALLLAETGLSAPPPAVAAGASGCRTPCSTATSPSARPAFCSPANRTSSPASAQALFEAGGKVKAAIATVASPQLETAAGGPGAGRRPGGRRGASRQLRPAGHATATARRWPTAAARPWWCAACPTGRRSAAQLKSDLLYEGGRLLPVRGGQCGQQMAGRQYDHWTMGPMNFDRSACPIRPRIGLTMTGYTDTIRRYATDTRFAGALENADGTGEVGLGADEAGRRLAVRFTLRVEAERVAAVRFQVFGCGFTIAACAVAAELAEGRPLDAVAASIRQRSMPRSAACRPSAATARSWRPRRCRRPLQKCPQRQPRHRRRAARPLRRGTRAAGFGRKSCLPPAAGQPGPGRRRRRRIATSSPACLPLPPANPGLSPPPSAWTSGTWPSCCRPAFPASPPPLSRAGRSARRESPPPANPEVLGVLRSHLDPRRVRLAAEWLTRILAARAAHPGHLWVAMGFFERPELSAAIRRHLPSLAAANNRGMRWKRYLFKQVCDRHGARLCKAPDCGICSDYALCFAPEEA